MTSNPPAATIRIDTGSDLTIFRQMLDKHQKGTEATKNTVESFGGDPHAMDNVLYCIEKWRRQAVLQFDALQPKGDAAVAGTPIGDAMAKAEASERVAALTPDPAFLQAVGGPLVGTTLHWPGDVETTITAVHAVTQRGDTVVGFDVSSSDGWKGGIVPHFNKALGVRQWRVEGANYATPTVSDPIVAALSDDTVHGNGAGPTRTLLALEAIGKVSGGVLRLSRKGKALLKERIGRALTDDELARIATTGDVELVLDEIALDEKLREEREGELRAGVEAGEQARGVVEETVAAANALAQAGALDAESPAERAAREADEELGESPTPPRVQRGDATQRTRNKAAAGVTSSVRAAPKPSAARKGGRGR